MHEEAHSHLSQPQKSHHQKQIIGEIFSIGSLPERSLFDQVKVAGYVTPGAALMSSSSADITPTPSDEILPTTSSQLRASTVMSVCFFDKLKFNSIIKGPR